MRLDLNINICFVSPADANHPARDIEVVWFGPKLLDSNEEEQGPAYGNVAFNMPAHWIELLITKKGFKCYWMENFVWPRNIAVRCSLLTEPHSLIGQKCRFLLTRKTLALKEYFPLTSTDGPWLIRSAHFAQKKYMEGPHSQCRRLDLEFMIGVWEVRP